MSKYDDITPDFSYDSPINFSQTMDAMKLMIQEEYDRQIVRAVQQIGIDINKEGLIEALNHDRKRYEAAYKKGWQECESYYKEKLRRISEMATIKEITPYESDEQ